MPEAYLTAPTYLAIPRRRRRDVGHFRRVIDAARRRTPRGAKRMVRARKVSAERFAANVLPMIRAVQAIGFKSNAPVRQS